MSETVTVREAAAILRCHESTVRARVNDRSRPDAFPLEAIDKSLHGIRIHRSALPVAVRQPTPIRPVDLPHGRRDSVDDRVATLISKIRELQAAHLEVVTENIRLKQENELLKLTREVA